MKVFLGGTVAANRWREEKVIPALVKRGIPEEVFINPRVEKWNEQARQNEEYWKENADILVYVLASPAGDQVSEKGATAAPAYSTFEATRDFYHVCCGRAAIVIETSGMSRRTQESMEQMYRIMKQERPNAPLFRSYDDLIYWLAQEIHWKLHGAA